MRSCAFRPEDILGRPGVPDRLRGRRRLRMLGALATQPLGHSTRHNGDMSTTGDTREATWRRGAKGTAAAAIILDADGRLLLVKHSYGPLNWEIPGGAAEPDETPVETALREVREETGLTATAERLTGIYYERKGPGRDHALHLLVARRPSSTDQRLHRAADQRRHGRSPRSAPRSGWRAADPDLTRPSIASGGQPARMLVRALKPTSCAASPGSRRRIELSGQFGRPHRLTRDPDRAAESPAQARRCVRRSKTHR